MKDNCKFTRRCGENISIPSGVCDDERLSDAAILLYGRLQRLITEKGKGSGSANISLQAICEVTRKKRRQMIYIINNLLSAGYLRKSKTSFGAANSYALVDPLEGVHQDLTAFFEFSHYFNPKNIKASRYDDAKKLLNFLESVEWQYRKCNKPIANPAGLIHQIMTGKVKFVDEDDFVSGWWKKLLDKDLKDKKAAALLKKKEELERTETARMERWLKSLSKSEMKERREFAIDAIRRNGGMPKYGAEITIQHKMWELYTAGKKKTPTLFGR